MPTNLFGEEQELSTHSSRGFSPIQQMHAMYGRDSNHTCGNCLHIRKVGRNNPYFKCLKFGVSHSSATDWRAKWFACGLFKEREQS